MVTAQKNMIDFYPRPPRGGRPASRTARAGIPSFLPTPSARRATVVSSPRIRASLFLPTPSARRATREELIQAYKAAKISTHALREEGD